MDGKLITTGAAAAALLLAGAASAQTGASHDPTTIKSGDYVVEPAHTQVLFDVDHLGFSRYYGQFSGVAGTLKLDVSNPSASKVSVRIPTASVTTTSGQLTGELKGKAWLDASAYPTISFVSTSVTPTGPASARIIGDLTLHGVTRAVTLDATFHGGGVMPMINTYTIGFDAVGHLKRSEFGIAAYVPYGLGDDVEVIIAAAFNKPK